MFNYESKQVITNWVKLYPLLLQTLSDLTQNYPHKLFPNLETLTYFSIFFQISHIYGMHFCYIPLMISVELSQRYNKPSPTLLHALS